jgi:hypothetical protein
MVPMKFICLTNRVLPRSLIVLFLTLAHAPGGVSCASEAPVLCVIDNVPLTDAIRNVARQMELNFILDPNVPGAAFVGGRRSKEPLISNRWTNTSPEQVLRSILKSHQLILVTNPATTVARIAPGSVAVWPVSSMVLGIESDTNQPVPLIVIDGVPLLDVLVNFCRQAGLTVTFDPGMSQSFESDCEVNVRWEDLTVRQGLAALLDNYGLVLKEDPLTRTARIRSRNRQPRKETNLFGW